MKPHHGYGFNRSNNIVSLLFSHFALCVCLSSSKAFRNLNEKTSLNAFEPDKETKQNRKKHKELSKFKRKKTPVIK